MAKIVFLHTRVTGYFLSCIEAHVRKNSGDEIHVVHYAADRESPFSTRELPRTHFYLKSDYRETHLIDLIKKRIAPDAVVCAGWADKEYLAVAKEMSLAAETTLTCDNYWEGSTKQMLAAVVARFYLPSIFHKIWVPGEHHTVYAKRLGFSSHRILTDLYSCDVNTFDECFRRTHEAKAAEFPHRFLYVGRYIELKGVRDLWQGFRLYKERHPDSDWELWCVGSGELEDEKPIADDIKHLGFTSPEKLPGIAAQAGVFVMPSHYDHWGVAVHEFAVSGFPLVCSDRVASSWRFLKEGSNGYSFQAHNVESLATALEKVAGVTDQRLYEMSQESHTSGVELTVDSWSASLKRAA